MAKMDFFDDVYEPDEPSSIELEQYYKQVHNQKRKRQRLKQKDDTNEVGKAPPPSPEILAEREKYANDFVLMHKEVFPDSTGVKPFGKVQQNSIYMGQDVFHKGGGMRLLKLEPRGYAKTTRLTNEALYAVLQGIQDYIVIVCSNVTKAAEIIDSIKTELMNNDKLLELFPGPVACFRHLDNNSGKSRYQTYEGEATFIKYELGTIRFPIVAGEPSSGKFIEIRPLRNLKGLNHKIKAGPNAGKVMRPTLLLFDDPQTYGEAHSEPDRSRIIATIKRDALKGGATSKRVSAIMAITPVCNGDVAFHFEKAEHSWEIVKYKMLEKMPDAHDVWMSEYARIYLNYDRQIRGDRTRAHMAARKFVEDNYEMLHKGAEATWEYAYGWDENPQTEISPVQHAYNIILDDGWEDFEYECQCNTDYGLYEEGETIHAPKEVILSKATLLPRRRVYQATAKVVTHIDVGKSFLSYVTIASADPFRPHIVDYGTHPQQLGLFSKRNVSLPLKSMYPLVSDYREVIYLAVKDLLQTLANKPYLREDGIQVFNSAIGVDVKYEEDYTLRACKDSGLNTIVVPCWGMFIGPDDDLIHEKRWPQGSRIYYNCAEVPNVDRTYDYLNVDANFFKTEVHKAFNQTAGLNGALTIFAPEYTDQHKIIAEHCNSERPERRPGKKTNRTRVCWVEKQHQADNEYLDNIAGCFALLSRAGIEIKPTAALKENKKKDEVIDIAEYMKQQKGKII